MAQKAFTFTEGELEIHNTLGSMLERKSWFHYDLSVYDQLLLKTRILLFEFGPPEWEQCNCPSLIDCTCDRDDKTFLLDAVANGYDKDKHKIVDDKYKLIHKISLPRNRISIGFFVITSKNFVYPMVRVMGKDNIILIDSVGRVYNSWKDFDKNNKLPKGDYTYPLNGCYQRNSSGDFLLMKGKNSIRIGPIIEKVGYVLPLVASLYPPLTIPAYMLRLVGISIVIAKGSYNLMDRHMHHQSVGLASTETHKFIIMILMNALAPGKNKRIQSIVPFNKDGLMKAIPNTSQEEILRIVTVQFIMDDKLVSAHQINCQLKNYECTGKAILYETAGNMKDLIGPSFLSWCFLSKDSLVDHIKNEVTKISFKRMKTNEKFGWIFQTILMRIQPHQIDLLANIFTSVCNRLGERFNISRQFMKKIEIAVPRLIFEVCHMVKNQKFKMQDILGILNLVFKLIGETLPEEGEEINDEKIKKIVCKSLTIGKAETIEYTEYPILIESRNVKGWDLVKHIPEHLFRDKVTTDDLGMDSNNCNNFVVLRPDHFGVMELHFELKKAEENFSTYKLTLVHPINKYSEKK